MTNSLKTKVQIKREWYNNSKEKSDTAIKDTVFRHQQLRIAILEEALWKTLIALRTPSVPVQYEINLPDLIEKALDEENDDDKYFNNEENVSDYLDER